MGRRQQGTRKHFRMGDEEVQSAMDVIEDKRDAARDAFEDLCMTVDKLIEEKAEKQEAARARFEHLMGRYRNLRVRRNNLRTKYTTLLDKYNELAEELKDRSDSDSSDDEEYDGTCSIM